MEGEFHVQSVTPLKINYPRATILGGLLSLTIIGIIALRYSKKLRMTLLYDTLP